MLLHRPGSDSKHEKETLELSEVLLTTPVAVKIAEGGIWTHLLHCKKGISIEKSTEQGERRPSDAMGAVFK